MLDRTMRSAVNDNDPRRVYRSSSYHSPPFIVRISHISAVVNRIMVEHRQPAVVFPTLKGGNVHIKILPPPRLDLSRVFVNFFAFLSFFAVAGGMSSCIILL